MKRFITYLYEYERGQKSKNTGFVRIDERSGIVNLQVCVRNYIRSHEKGKIYAYAWDNELLGIELGKISLINGQSDIQFHFKAEDIEGSGYSLDEIVGVGILFSNNGYVASCWKDEFMDAISSGQFESILHRGDIRVAEEVIAVAEEELEIEEVPPAQEPLQLPAVVTYQKMELNEIRNLPSPNWYLCNNRFLVHGFFNYRYLILKKTMENDVEKTYLGVPGVFEKPEMVMATLFGFSEFQEIPQEVSTSQMGETVRVPHIEKSQEPKAGIFGCWLVPLEL